MTSLFKIPTYPGYLATNDGRIWSEKSERYLKLGEGKYGSFRINLSINGIRYSSVGVHRLVCEAFHGPAPEDKPWALHRNGQAGDNRPENLYWGNAQDNVDDMIRHGTQRNQVKSHCKFNHPFDSDNTYTFSDGSRGCRECHRDDMRSMNGRGLPTGDNRHGTNTGYANWGCRCSNCRSARREYVNARRVS